MAQYLLKNAAILTMDADFTLYEDGYLAVEGNSIQEIGPTAQLEESRFAGYTVLDCRGKIITPAVWSMTAAQPALAVHQLAERADSSPHSSVVLIATISDPTTFHSAS